MLSCVQLDLELEQMATSKLSVEQCYQLDIERQSQLDIERQSQLSL